MAKPTIYKNVGWRSSQRCSRYFRLGGDSAFFGRVGQDPLGRFMKQVLKDEGVDTQYMLLDEEHRHQP